ncbi:hypothetical protein ACFSTI_05505 [Rhizorhabdus histidinilytica]|jgi:hypothetical protein|uniref:Uncharacterized protein n=1 Tax=Rhizorhabdus histidinilytica TaxID=439228 RepID=A0A1T5AIR9_9SPHN|nr:hypothetical protein [Rhizorhabdus histidinilytica]QEH79812.1 hypothetical protein EIK56_17380 [Sphingomonas sp. C8-2]SKB34856.1 hypothetical protein SAMN06295920_10213 [Rhizorhabdus histidinilytica]
MMAILIAAAATVAETPPPPPPALHRGVARSVIESQLATPPRTGAGAGLIPEEADAIIQRYIASIGQRLDPDEEKGPR